MKQYIVVRTDLTPGAQAAQACHALRLFGEEHPEIARHWYENSSNLVLLGVPDEKALESLCEKSAGFAYSKFHEPDLGDSLTAIGLEPGAGKLLGNLPLLLR